MKERETKVGKKIVDRRLKRTRSIVEKEHTGTLVLAEFRAVHGSDLISGTTVSAPNLVEMVRAIEKGGFGGKPLPENAVIQRLVRGTWVNVPSDVVRFAVGCARRTPTTRLFRVELGIPVGIGERTSIKVVELGVQDEEDLGTLLDKMAEAERFPVCLVLRADEFWRWEWIPVPHSELMKAKKSVGCDSHIFTAVVYNNRTKEETTLEVTATSELDVLNTILSASASIRTLRTLKCEGEPVENLSHLVEAFKRDVLKSR